ncbi:hypothetical protein GFL92_01525 [Rhizobium leguminosarum bv. viciae]|nr:hypothetical protein [Rhizobium leguminosarum bv. viciae]
MRPSISEKLQSANVQPSYFGPAGVDPHNWAFAKLLGSCIHDLEKKKLLGYHSCRYDGSAEALKSSWTKVQAKEAVRRPELTEWLNFDPISVPEFNLYLKNYRACDGHYLAAVPTSQWTKPTANWDDHVYAVTLMLSIELPHPMAKAKQQSLEFAVAYVASLPGMIMKSAVDYRAYQAAIETENSRRADQELMPLVAFDRLMVERIPRWFPKLVARAIAAATSVSKAA